MPSKPYRRRIGVFGGTFNPIHYGHLRVADAVRKRLGLDEMRLVPSARPPHKIGRSDVVSGKDRLAMARLGASEFHGLVVSDVEFRRPGPSFTVDTLEALRSETCGEADLFLVIGADTLPEIPTWRDAPRLADLARIIAVNRPDCPIRVTDELVETFGAARTKAIVGDAIVVDPVPISATEVRERARLRERLTGLVPEAVEKYIVDRSLYTAPQGRSDGACGAVHEDP